MKLGRMIAVAAAAALLAAAPAGCAGNGKYAKVSGIVTFNGKAYKNAVVSFQPIGTKDNPNPGRGSSGVTDEAGRFTLMTDDGHAGAVVGKHRVRIVTQGNTGGGYDPTLGSPDNTDTRTQVDPIPPEWHEKSTKEFEVPPEGTDQANFHIVTKKK